MTLTGNKRFGRLALLALPLLIATIIAGCLGPGVPVPPPPGRIAFAVQQGGQWDIWVINENGTGLINLTQTSTANELHPSWSPDGKHLAYSSDRGGSYQIYTHNVASGQALNLTAGTVESFMPAWSPHVNEVASINGPRSLPGAGTELVVRGADRTLGGPRYVDTIIPKMEPLRFSDPVWSPDGTELSVVVWQDTGVGYVSFLWFTDRSTRDGRGYGSGLGSYHSPAWGAGGYAVAKFTGVGDDLFLVTDLDAVEEWIKLTPQTVDHIAGASWSPDGKRIVYAAQRNGRQHLYLLGLDGTQVSLTEGTPLEHADRLAYPSWAPVW